MRFTASADIAAPIEQVFGAATDHEGFVRRAERRGAEVRRTDRLGQRPGRAPLPLGAAWRASFPFRGRERRVEVHLARLEPPTLAEALVEGGGFAARLGADLLALSRDLTRLTLAVDVQARTLSGRVMLQGMRFARGAVERRMKARLLAWAREVEAQARRARPGGAGGAGQAPTGGA
jgi:hypothetical protein